MIAWDEKKRQRVIRKHGVDFEKIEDAFNDPYAIVAENHKHGGDEERWLLIGRSSAYGLISVVYTIREDNFHVITSRRAEKWMMRCYEQQRQRL